MFLIMFCWTELLLKKVWEFSKVVFGMHYIRVFHKFPDDPYYELLQWFTIIINNMEKWVVFFKSLKKENWKMHAFNNILLYWKKIWEAFWVNFCLPRWFLACIILGCFVNFLVYPYYELLLWFISDYQFFDDYFWTKIFYLIT